MAKILCIGDPHLKITKFDLACQFLKWINSVIWDVRPDIVVNLGDTFDTHAVIRSEVMNEFKKHVDYVADELGIKYYYLLGNHDMYKPNDSSYHALQIFKNKHETFVVVDKRIDEGNLTFLPYFFDHKQFPLDTKEICFAHQTFVGADYGYIRPEVGVMAEDVKAEVIISGHVHIRQEFGKVIYPGSPYSQSINDVDQVKGVMIFDTDTYEKQFIECPLPMWRKLSYEIKPDLTIQEVHKDISNTINEKDHWTVCIKGPKVELLAYIESKELNGLRKKADLAVKPTFTDKEKRLVSIQAISMEKIMQEYVDNVYNGTMDKTVLKDKVLEIIKQVNNT